MCSFLFVSVEYFLFVCCVMVLLIANILLAADVMPVLTSTFVSFSPLSRYLLWLHSALLLFLLAHHFQTSLIGFNHLCLFTLNTSHPSIHLLGLLSSLCIHRFWSLSSAPSSVVSEDPAPPLPESNELLNK